jgi:hypothetical protein
LLFKDNTFKEQLIYHIIDELKLQRENCPWVHLEFYRRPTCSLPWWSAAQHQWTMVVIENILTDQGLYRLLDGYIDGKVPYMCFACSLES